MEPVPSPPKTGPPGDPKEKAPPPIAAGTAVCTAAPAKRLPLLALLLPEEKLPPLPKRELKAPSGTFASNGWVAMLLLLGGGVLKRPPQLPDPPKMLVATPPLLAEGFAKMLARMLLPAALACGFNSAVSAVPPAAAWLPRLRPIPTVSCPAVPAPPIRPKTELPEPLELLELLALPPGMPKMEPKSPPLLPPSAGSLLNKPEPGAQPKRPPALTLELLEGAAAAVGVSARPSLAEPSALPSSLPSTSQASGLA
mmetsp:Transcript_77044/g.178702  ORF Transcript_77044/g.178702 Transcript_77044/m.178702 type:complete len:254 (-) Transcript_77044:75-836(-)